MKHYICGGTCGGESNKAGVCETIGCDHEGEALLECECENGLHVGTPASAALSEDFEMEEDNYE